MKKLWVGGEVVKRGIHHSGTEGAEESKTAHFLVGGKDFPFRLK